MKKAFKLFSMLMIASLLTLTFSSCEKDPVEKPNTEQGDDDPTTLTAQDLAGTSWQCTLENTIVKNGVTINISYENILDFTDTEKGEYFEMAVIEFPQYPSGNQQMDQTVKFTYTVVDNKIMITVVETDETSGEETVETSEYIYNAETQTITHDTNDPEMEQLMGTDTYIFTKVQ